MSSKAQQARWHGLLRPCRLYRRPAERRLCLPSSAASATALPLRGPWRIIATPLAGRPSVCRRRRSPPPPPPASASSSSSSASARARAAARARRYSSARLSVRSASAAHDPAASPAGSGSYPAPPPPGAAAASRSARRGSTKGWPSSRRSPGTAHATSSRYAGSAGPAALMGLSRSARLARRG